MAVGRSRRARRGLLLAGMLALLVGLGGCGRFFAFDPGTLMAPPTATADQQAIYRLLQNDGADISFVYPKSGRYRSAITMQDFTGDGQQDAIGFYVPDSTTGGVEVQFLVQEDGVWGTAASFRNTALQVDRVYFTDLTGDGAQDVVIGWGSIGATGRTAAAAAYVYRDGTVLEYALGNYGEMVVSDFDSDGLSEIFTIDMSVPAQEEDGPPTPARARIYAFQQDRLGVRYMCEADSSVSSYSAVTFGLLAPETPAVTVDGVRADGVMTTQVFTLFRGRLMNAPLGVNQEEYLNPFERPSSTALTCRDIDGDGLLEIPTAAPLPWVDDTPAQDLTRTLVTWNRFDVLSGCVPVLHTVMNPSENYFFPIPTALSDPLETLTTVNDPEARTLTVRSLIALPDRDPALGPILFTVQVFPRQQWELSPPEGYEAVNLQAETVYAIRAVTLPAEPTRQIVQGFRLISE